MPNFLEKIFLSKYELNILKTIEKYNVKRTEHNWTEKKDNNNREFNRSSVQFSVNGNGLTIDANREYEEKLEASLMPSSYFILTVKPHDSADKIGYRREFNTRFAKFVYKKMLAKYQAEKHNAR